MRSSRMNPGMFLDDGTAAGPIVPGWRLTVSRTSRETQISLYTTPGTMPNNRVFVHGDDCLSIGKFLTPEDTATFICWFASIHGLSVKVVRLEANLVVYEFFNHT